MWALFSVGMISGLVGSATLGLARWLGAANGHRIAGLAMLVCTLVGVAFAAIAAARRRRGQPEATLQLVDLCLSDVRAVAVSDGDKLHGYLFALDASTCVLLDDQDGWFPEDDEDPPIDCSLVPSQFRLVFMVAADGATWELERTRTGPLRYSRDASLTVGDELRSSACWDRPIAFLPTQPTWLAAFAD